ncbi:MAG: FtsX-like permease family protein [Bacteroidales bacterium]
MIRSIFKRLLKGRGRRNVLLLELLLSFLAFFLILAFVLRLLDNERQPMGFAYQNLYKVSVEHLAEVEGMKTEDRLESLRNYLRHYPGVETYAESMSSFYFQKGYLVMSSPLTYKETSLPNDQVHQFLADDDFQEAMQIRMLEGRWFNETDNASPHRPVVLSESLKNRLFGENSPLGEQLGYSDYTVVVVGVYRDFKHKGDFTQIEPTLILRQVNLENLPYETYWGMNGSYCGPTNILRARGDVPPGFAAELTREVATNFPGMEVSFSPMEKLREQYIRKTWLPLVLVFSVVLALFLNVLFGLFGVLWYNISMRRSEIGLRMAVGASKRHIQTQFLLEMLVLTTLALVPGLILAAQAPLLHLFDIHTAVYLLAMVLAALLIYLLVTLCVLLPSTQAARIRPALALHDE